MGKRSKALLPQQLSLSSCWAKLIDFDHIWQPVTKSLHCFQVQVAATSFFLIPWQCSWRTAHALALELSYNSKASNNARAAFCMDDSIDLQMVSVPCSNLQTEPATTAISHRTTSDKKRPRHHHHSHLLRPDVIHNYKWKMHKVDCRKQDDCLLILHFSVGGIIQAIFAALFWLANPHQRI